MIRKRQGRFAFNPEPTLKDSRQSPPEVQPAANRTIKALWDAVGPLLEQLTPAECTNYLKAAGYDPN